MSSRRSSRKRKPTPNDISASYYVGYAEDAEPVEVIMKKFEELDRLKTELADKKKSLEGSSMEISTASNAADSDTSREQELTQEDLEELFKRTSSFTVKQAALGLNPDEFDDLELLRMEYDDIDEFEEENNYQFLPDDVSDDDEDEDIGTRRKYAKSGGRKYDRQALIEKYRLMRIEMNDSAGTYFIHKKVPSHSPNVYSNSSGTYTSVLGETRTALRSLNEEGFLFRQFYTNDIFGFDFKDIGNQHLVLYIDPPILLPDEEYTPGKITLEMLSKLDVPSIIENGFIFIWAEKEIIPNILKIGRSWGFKYVENFTSIKMLHDNSIFRKSYKYICKSTITCLILRTESKCEENNIELKHQRNPDSEFSFVSPMKEGHLTERRTSTIYKVIETLLPTANYKPGVNEFDKPRMVEVYV